jgi:tetratricopeptide (TPR) repeat protein
MKRSLVCLLLLSVGTSARAENGSLAEARQRWLHGNYEEARELYERLAANAQYKVAATIGLSRAWQSQGEYDKALSAVDAALSALANNSELLARRAELLYLRGRWEESEKAADSAIAVKLQQFLARWVRAQIYWNRADFKKADEEFRWFVRTYTERSNKDDDIKDPEELVLVGLAGAENARWHNLGDQFRFILTDVYEDALRQDKDFWPAEYQAGMLLLEKYNRGDALPAFDKALAINPQAAEVLVGKGVLSLQRYEVREAEQFAERALKINPNLTEALRLKADVQILSGELKDAVHTLEQARKINPRDEETLGRLAACARLQQNADPEKKTPDPFLDEVRRFDSRPGIYFYSLAERLEARRHFEEAEEYYKKAIEQRAMVPGPRNSLGLLYMRLGREKEAQEVLNQAFKADEFNVQVSNSLKVLRHLEKYETQTTEHFILRFDPQTDGVLARYMTGYLEDTYRDLSQKFRYQPPKPILIEIFNNHEMFSGRITALPDLHTIGASTGRIIAMDSPFDKGLPKPFNWARVVRHELVHIFNLEQTRFQCPHWFTEGLAVINEGFARPQEWNELLRLRVPSGDVMNLDNIDLGFIRPRSPLDWHMAYCQSQLYIEYLREKFGAKTIGGMLAAYQKGVDTPDAIAQVCRVDKATFEKGYRAYLDEVVKGLEGRPVEKPMSYSQLQQAYEKEPGNADLAGRLAEQHLLRRDKKEARKLVEDVLAKSPAHPLASYVKARLLLDAGDDAQAQTVLEAAVQRDKPEPKVLHALGKMYYESRQFAKAADMYELAHHAEPYEGKWLVELLRAYNQLEYKTKQIDVLKQLVATDPDDLEQRKRLTRLLLDAKQFDEAARFARESLEIDVRDAEARDYLIQALEEQHKNDEAEKLRQLLAK